MRIDDNGSPILETVGDLLAMTKSLGADEPEDNKKMRAAIEADKRAKALSADLHPLKDYPYSPMRYPIDPSA